MSFATIHKLVTYLIAGLGLYSLTFGGEMKLPVVLLLGAAFIGSWFAEGERTLSAAYARNWTLSVFLVFFIQFFRGVSMGEPILGLAVEFAAFLQISRLFNRRSAREYQQIAVLAFMHLIAATVLSTELGYAFIFFGFVVVTPWMLALSHLRREIEGNYPGAGEVSGRAVADVRRVLASRRVVGGRFLVGTALLSLPLFLMTASLFVIFPRVGMGFLSFRSQSGRHVAGFGNNIELGGFGTIADDPTVVLRFNFPPVERNPPPRLVMRFRGTSFDKYDGRRWTRTASHRREPFGGDNFPVVRPRNRGDVPMRIVLDPIDEPVVFLPAGTMSFSLQPKIEAARARQRTILKAPGLDLRYDADGMTLVYTAFVEPRSNIADIERPTAEERARYLAIPPGHEEVVALAQRVTRTATTDRERLGKLMFFLHENPAFTYSLDQQPTRGKPPLVAFLLHHKKGHCEYFATGLAIMLRATGVPTRVVTGYLGGRFNPYGKYYAVRQGDAHSWVEAYIEGRGWMTFDPTPPDRNQMTQQERALSGIDAMLDALRMRWQQRVVGYDLRSQVQGMRGIGRWLSRNLPSRGGSRGTRGAQDQASKVSPVVGYAGMGVLALLALGFAVWRWRADRTKVPAHVTDPAARDAVELYRDLERALAKRGRPRAEHVTPLEHASAMRDEGFVGAEEVREVTEHYMRARYAGEPLSPREVSRLRDLVARVRVTPREPPRPSA